MTIYIAIYKAASGEEFFIEYRPLYDVCAGATEILSASVNKRPHTWQEQRKAYRQTYIQRKPRQLDLFKNDK